MRLRFSLRTMLLGTLVLSLVMGIGVEAYRRRAARANALNWDRNLSYLNSKPPFDPRFRFGPPARKTPQDISISDAFTRDLVIFHVRDWHLVPREDFAADIGFSGHDLDAAYTEHVNTLKAVQVSQRRAREGCCEAGCEVYCEGLSKSDFPVFLVLIRLQQQEPFEPTLLHLGAAAQLMVEGKVTVLPCEEDAEHASANPLKGGDFVLDDAATEAREDAIVRNLVKSTSGRAVIVLGGAHDPPYTAHDSNSQKRECARDFSASCLAAITCNAKSDARDIAPF